jgi:hypothetical protein
MAKMFYTMEETQATLGRNEEDIKQLTREGRLREYRDGARLMYKADQVEALKGELGAGGTAAGGGIDLAGSESGAPIGLVDSRSGGSGSVIGLADSVAKDDTALAADLGGSAAGVPSPGRGGSRSGTGTGVTVFGLDDNERADPSAQTAISPGASSDQINLEQVGSGSGLLDLTRESDDTSLGAELLDEIQPGKQKRAKAPISASDETAAGGTAGAGLTGVESAVVRAPLTTTTVERADPMAPAFGGAALGATLAMLFAAIGLISATIGYQPAFLARPAALGMLALAGILFVPVIIFSIIGLFLGRAAR